MNKNVTIADVANHLGVSKSTVSHALSGKRRISTEVCAEVMRAVKELGYRPNFAARVMNTHRTGLVGVLVERIDNPHTTALLEALGREFSRHSMQMVLGTTEKLDGGRALLTKFSAGMVDGILNTLPELDADEAAALAGSTPLITYRRHRQAALTIDFAAGTCAALAHLLELGHRRIALIPATNRVAPGQPDPCIAAYRRKMTDSGEAPTVLSADGGTVQAGIAAAPELFASGVTAVLAGNDSIAAGLIQWAVANRRRIPDELSLIGHDDSPLAAMTYPPLTTLRLPIDPIAAHTVQVLMHEISPDEPIPEPLNIVPELVIRQSVRHLETNCR